MDLFFFPFPVSLLVLSLPPSFSLSRDHSDRPKIVSRPNRIGPCKFSAAKSTLVDSCPLSNCGAQALDVSAALDVGIRIGSGLGRERAVGRPQVDEVLHGLQLAGLQHLERRGRQDKVAEATVELLLQVEVVKGLHEVVPVKMGVDAEDLAEYQLTGAPELLGKAASGPKPLVGTLLGGIARVLGVNGKRHGVGVGRE